MNFSKFIPAILGALGLSKFSKVDGKEQLTAEECAKLKEFGFPDKFVTEFNAYLANPVQEEAASPNSRAAVLSAALGQVTAQYEAVNAELTALKASNSADKEAHAEAIRQKEATIAELNARVATLSALPDVDPVKPQTGAASQVLDLDDCKQLGGMQGAFYSMDRAYNKRARAAMLAAQGVEVSAPSAQSVDYKSLQEDLGAFYLTRWTDRLQSLLVNLPAISDIFPLEAGHSNFEVLVSLFLGEFSQADTSSKSDFDKVVKGSYEFGTEVLRMYDVMFVHRFKSLKDLEKSWLGYLNRDSNPVKLSFIEYLLVETAKALHNEQQLRFVNGVRKEPDVNKPGKAMDAADGIYEFIRKRVEGFIDFAPASPTANKLVYQIKPFNLPRITPGNIGEVFYEGTAAVPAKYRDTGRVKLYVPSWMIPVYHKYNETMYGQNVDFKGGIMYVREFPNVEIVAIPNADGHSRIFWTFEGNIKTYTLVAGEMFRFTLEQHNWSVDVWSNWKESIQAEAVGRKFTDPADMDGSEQVIWCNDYDRDENCFLEADPDKNPSAALHSSIVTAKNSAVFTITNIDDVKPGQAVTLKCGHAGDSGVTIKAEGAFELLSGDWTPKKGETLKLMKRADGKFIELGRSTVAGNSYQFDADETAPSVLGATVFVIGKNTTATEITDLEDAVPGVVYTIHGAGDAETASTIANGGKFVLTESVVLKAGKFIQLVQASDGKFYEVARG